MSMSDLPAETEPFIAVLDAAVEANMNWSRRILCCARRPARMCSIPWHTPCAVSAPGSWKTGPGSAGEMEDLSSVLKRADQALYQGKDRGRDRYVIAHPDLAF